MLSVQFPPLEGPNSFVTSPADQPGISAKSEGASGSAVRKIVNYNGSLCSNCVQGIENDSKTLGDIIHLHPSLILFYQNYPNLLSSSSLSSPYAISISPFRFPSVLNSKPWITSMITTRTCHQVLSNKTGHQRLDTDATSCAKIAKNREYHEWSWCIFVHSCIQKLNLNSM